MSMKKTIVITALAAAVSTSIVGVVSAAQMQQMVETQKTSLFVNDTSTQIRTVKVNGISLLSVRDLGTAAGVYFVLNEKGGVKGFFMEHTIELRSGMKQITVDGEVRELKAAIENVNNSYYITLDDFVSALGAEAATDDAGQI